MQTGGQARDQDARIQRPEAGHRRVPIKRKFLAILGAEHGQARTEGTVLGRGEGNHDFFWSHGRTENRNPKLSFGIALFLADAPRLPSLGALRKLRLAAFTGDLGFEVVQLDEIVGLAAQFVGHHGG